MCLAELIRDRHVDGPLYWTLCKTSVVGLLQPDLPHHGANVPTKDVIMADANEEG